MTEEKEMTEAQVLRQKRREELVALKEKKKSDLKAYMSKYSTKDLRILYLRDAPMVITAVSLLNHEEQTVTIAFSFCSNKDSFNKLEGKLKAFVRLESEEDHDYRITVPWNGDGLMATAIAFQQLKNKPSKLAKAKVRVDIW